MKILRRRLSPALLTRPSGAAPASSAFLHMQEEMIRAPSLLLPQRVNAGHAGQVKLDKTHPYTQHLVGAWPVFYGSPFIPDLCGNNHARATGFTQLKKAFYPPYGMGLGNGINTSTQRLDLGSIDSNNPLSMSTKNEFSVFAFGVLAVTADAQNGIPRVIDKSNGGSASGGWALAYRLGSAAAPNNALEFYAATAARSSGDDTLGSAEADYTGFPTGFGCTCASGDSHFTFGSEMIGTNTSTWTIASTTTNAALLNWNHSNDRQWGKWPMYMIYVWDEKIDYDILIDLHYDPYQILIPA